MGLPLVSIRVHRSTRGKLLRHCHSPSFLVGTGLSTVRKKKHIPFDRLLHFFYLGVFISLPSTRLDAFLLPLDARFLEAQYWLTRRFFQWKCGVASNMSELCSPRNVKAEPSTLTSLLLGQDVITGHLYPVSRVSI
ncbi:hypothetical protein J3F83DRAFT_523163 [Trichoderma novae-zelandiae]